MKTESQLLADFHEKNKIQRREHARFLKKAKKVIDSDIPDDEKIKEISVAMLDIWYYTRLHFSKKKSK